MDRERLVELVSSLEPEGAEINRIAEELGIWQTEASNLANRLVKEGVLIKKGRSPVRYYLAPREEKQEEESQPFSGIIGYDGSLSVQIQMARAAVCYPPNGLHMLILGATGVGKTMLAREIWRSAVWERGKEIPFVSFNCAEYADNPQLLLSQLFGHEKGAFTGATEEKEGLIDRANGGILFLDEIHRLSSTGQETLFSVIDHGSFRRLGGVAEHRVEVLILGATTENLESSLLGTFRRRIPVVLQLPMLRERPVRERFFLVSLFFSQEAARTGIPIRVSKNMLEYLVLFESESNIGDLKNEVILSSAYSYLEAKKSGHPEKMKELLVDSNTGSRRARSEQLKPEIRRMLSQFIPEDGWMFYPGEDAPSLPDDPPREQRNPGTYEFKPETYSQEDTNEYLFNYISPDIYAIANDLILEATQEFHEFYAKNIGNSLAFFLQQVKSYARVGRGLMEHANSLTEQRYSREIEFVQRKREELQQRLETELTEGELMSIAFLLGQRAVESQKNIGMVVAAYGEQIATGLADLVTRIFPDTPITALDYPLNTGFEVLKESVLEALQHADNGRGVILCSDISTLISREAELSALSNTECRIIPTVNTAMLLELAKDVCMTDLSLGELKQQISEEYRGYVRALFEPAAAMPLCKESVRTEKRGVIITYCITGTGSAKIARSLLLEQPEINAVADVIPMGIMSDLDSAAQQLGNRLRLVVGFLDPHIPNVPFVGLDSLFTQEGLQRILLYLQDWDAQDEEEDVPEDLSREEQLAIVEKNIPFFAPSLAADQVADSAGKVLSAILSRYKGKLEKDFAVRVYIHVIAMFERLATMEELAFSPQKKQEIAPYRSFFLWLYQILEDACRELGLALNETEVYYLMIVLPNPETGEEFLLK